MILTDLYVFLFSSSLLYFMQNGGHFGGHLASVSSNHKSNARNGLLVCITKRKVVLLDILWQMVQNLGFVMR